jgi:hypothetical protein
MASEGGIRAGKAYVELFADDSRLSQNMAAAEMKVRRFGSTVEDIHVNKIGKSVTKTGKAMSSMGKAIGDSTHSMSMIGTESKAIGASMMVLNGLMSGPAGWISLLVAGAGIAAMELLKVRQHLDYFPILLHPVMRVIAVHIDPDVAFSKPERRPRPCRSRRTGRAVRGTAP